MHSRFGVAGVLPLVVALVASAAQAPAMAQEQIRIDGTVMWVSGQTLTIALDGPVNPAYYMIVGQYVVPAAGPRPTVNVDLSRVPQSEYSVMRPGERVAVIGTVSSDRRRLIGTSIIRETDLQVP